MKLPITLGKKKSSSTSSRLPASDRVRMLSQEGYAEPEIIRALRSEGYSPAEADAAMKSAVRAAALPPSPRPPPTRDMFAPPRAEGRDPLASSRSERRDFFAEPRPPQENDDLDDLPEDDLPPRGELDLPELPQRRRPVVETEQEIDEDEEIAPPVRKRSRTNDIEEITEGVVEEKWQQFEHQMDELEDKMGKIEQRIQLLETSLAEFRGIKKTDVEEIKAAVASYKESMGEVSERMEAMERAVKDSLTPMMQSLRSLSDTLKVMKTGSSPASRTQ